MADKQLYKYLPKLRFPEFKDEGEWEVKKLCEIAEKRTERNRGNLPLPVLTNSATEGVLNQANYFEREIVTKDNLTNYYIVDKNDFVYNPRISSTAPVGPISRNKAERGIMSPLYTVFRFNKGDLDFFEQYFRTNYWHQYIKKKANFGARFDRINIAAEDFFNLPVPFPSDPEQTQIATALCSLDSLIQSCKKKQEQLKAHKKGLMQKLFPAPGKTLPEYRFPVFINDIAWDYKTLGEVTRFVNRRNKSNRSLPVYSINNKRGFVMQSEQFEGIDSKSRGYDITAYKIVTSNLFAYNPARINVGSYGYSGSINEGLISSLYVCFKTTDSIDDDFLKCFMDSYTFQKAVENNVEGGIRSYLFYDNFSRIQIPIPSIEEQRTVASAIVSINQLEDLYAEKLSILVKQKKGLMQVLFPNNR